MNVAWLANKGASAVLTNRTSSRRLRALIRADAMKAVREPLESWWMLESIWS